MFFCLKNGELLVGGCCSGLVFMWVLAICFAICGDLNDFRLYQWFWKRDLLGRWGKAGRMTFSKSTVVEKAAARVVVV